MNDKYHEAFTSNMKIAKERLCLSLNEASLIANESVPTLRRRIAAGILKAHQSVNRGRWLIHREDLDRYMGIFHN